MEYFFDVVELHKRFRTVRQMTICFPVRRDQSGAITDVCLAMKKRGFGVGKWNGVGGKVGDKPEIETESIVGSAVREIEEELTITKPQLKKVAEVLFYVHGAKQASFCHIFLVEDWDGEVAETEEMRPQWFSVDKLPYDQMWKRDREWLPLLFQDHKLMATFAYSPQDGSLAASQIKQLA